MDKEEKFTGKFLFQEMDVTTMSNGGGINVSSWEIYIDAPASALTTWNNFAKTFWKLQSSFSLIGSIELEIVIPTTKYILILISGLSAKNTLHNEVS